MAIIVIVTFFILINVVTIFHAYRFTHFADKEIYCSIDSNNLSLLEKLNVLIFGIKNPHPVNTTTPTWNYETICIDSNNMIECWKIDLIEPKGEVAIFHGYAGKKSSMLDRANEFLKLGYSVLLVDFMGSGGSEGKRTSIGFFEASQVKLSYDCLSHENKYLYGTSMGSVAISKAINDYGIKPKGIMLECPYGTMYKAVRNRFWNMGLPAFPFAYLLVFWGGILNCFWAFSHNAIDYAGFVECPTLLLHGESDTKVTKKEISDIYKKLRGKKTLKTYGNTGHDNIYSNNRDQWTLDIIDFMAH